MVPKGWEKGLFSDLADTVMGHAFKSSDFVKEGIPLVRMGNLYQNQFQLDRSPIYLPDEFATEYKRFLLQSGDLVMSMTGTMGKRDYGFAVEIPKNAPDCLLNQRVLKIKPRNSDARGFVLNVLKSEIFLSKIYSLPGGTKQANLSATQIREISVLIPPLPEQQRIAKILTTWDNAIRTTKRLIENSRQQKKALMQQLLTGKKRLLDDEGKRFEGEWARQPISFVADVITGNTPSTKNQEYYGGDKLFVSPSDLGISKYILETTKRLTDLGFSQTRKVPKGSSLFTCIGSTIGKLGIAGEELATNQQINSVCAKGNNCGEFIYYQLLFHAQQIKGSAATQAVPIINKTNFESQLIFSPASLEEQQKIAVVLTNADKEIELLEQQLADLQQEKKALMQQLLTGKRRVVVDGE